MPMDFPNMVSLIFAAQAHGFRKPRDNESEEIYRANLAYFVEMSGDRIEAQEIRTKHGWDKWTEDEKMNLLLRAFMNPTEESC